MAKHFIKKAVLLFIVAIMVITPVLGYANTVYAGTDDALDEIKGIFEGYTYGKVWNLHSSKSYLEGTIKYDKEADVLTFELVSYKDENKKERELTLKMMPDSNMMGDADISIEYRKRKGLILTATGKINVQECKSAKEISFEITDNKGNDYSSKKALQKGFRKVFDRGMTYWQSAVYEETCYDFTEMGFKRYKFHTGKIVHHNADFVCGDCGAQFPEWWEASQHIEDTGHVLDCSGCPGWDEYKIPWEDIFASLSKVKIP